VKSPRQRLEEMRARSGSSFDSRVERDHAEAQAKRKQARVVAELKVLELWDGSRYAKRAEAAAALEELWPKDPQDAGGRNDLAVAFAWLERWDEALAEIEKAVDAATAKAAEQRGEAKKAIEGLAGANAAKRDEIDKAIDAGTGAEAANRRSKALEAINLEEGSQAKKDACSAIKTAADAQAMKQRAEENRTHIRAASEAALA
jgi:hypothetical protein